MQIGGGNFTFDGITYSSPVFSYGPDLNGNGALLVFGKSNVANVYPDKKQMIMVDDFDATLDEIAAFFDKIKGTINASKRLYLSGKTAYAYPVTSSEFKEYNKVTANCFMAVAKWTEWLGYNVPTNILKDAKKDNTKYYTYNTYKKHKNDWEKLGYIGL